MNVSTSITSRSDHDRLTVANLGQQAIVEAIVQDLVAVFVEDALDVLGAQLRVVYVRLADRDKPHHVTC